MSWPSATDYISTVASPSSSFRDPDLAGRKVAGETSVPKRSVVVRAASDVAALPQATAAHALNPGAGWVVIDGCPTPGPILLARPGRARRGFSRVASWHARCERG